MGLLRLNLVCVVECGRGSVPQCVVRPFVVVETKVTIQSCMRRVPVCIVTQIYVLVLNAAPQPFVEHVVRQTARPDEFELYSVRVGSGIHRLTAKLRAIIHLGALGSSPHPSDPIEA